MASLQRRQEEEQEEREAAGGAGGSSSSAGRSSAAYRLAAAQEDLTLLKSDTTQLCKAWAGQLRTARLYVLAGTAGG